jgi:hypothetical protein
MKAPMRTRSGVGVGVGVGGPATSGPRPPHPASDKASAAANHLKNKLCDITSDE